MLKNKGFGELVMDVVADRLGDGFDVAIREVSKNNGVTLTGMTIMSTEDRVSPTIYLESLEEEYEKGNVSISGAADQIIKLYNEHRINGGVPAFAQELFSDPEKVYENVFPKVINAEKNKDLLEQCPHDRFLDLAVIYLYRVSNFQEVGGVGNVTIRNDLMKNCGLEHDRLRNSAMENLKRDGHVTMGLGEMLANMMGEIPGVTDDVVDVDSPTYMYIITNSGKFNGANCMLDNECFMELADKIGYDLFVLPSSIHEVICVADKPEVNSVDLAAMVREVNRTSVGPEDFLSDTLYKFSRQDRQLAIA